MIQDYEMRVEPCVAASDEAIVTHLSATEGVDPARVSGVRVLRRSVDARQRRVMVNLKVRAYIDGPVADDWRPEPIVYGNVAGAPRAVVVGAGPAGLFAALRLIELGVCPIVLERGKPVDRRRVDVARISREGVIDPDSNYAFGEGGAGAYSDGKLFTRSKKRGSVERILAIFNRHGAPDNILVDAHPHIGSDKLPGVIAAMRRTILEAGGEVHFEQRVNRLLTDGTRVTGVSTTRGMTVEGPVILATGHSARDVYTLLYESGIALQAKGLAVGVRLEHPQRLIDCIQYHSPDGRGPWLPAAEYTFTAQVDGRGVYSFCMCPGGVVVPAASAPGQLVVNGMSPSRRDTRWANSGMVVELHPEDLPDDLRCHGVLAMMRFQEQLERRAFVEAGRSQVAGAQRMVDFVDGRDTRQLPATSYPAGIQPSRLDRWLPAPVATRLRRGFALFGRHARGFLTNEAVVIGVETRTSSPLRIVRDPSALRSIGLEGLYPCGEGAGYAGGIVSSAIDGERCAEALAATLT